MKRTITLCGIPVENGDGLKIILPDDAHLHMMAHHHSEMTGEVVSKIMELQAILKKYGYEWRTIVETPVDDSYKEDNEE